jgi:hypothetical protein
MLYCEALVSVELPAGQLQLMIDTDSLINHHQQQQQQPSLQDADDQHAHQQSRQQQEQQQQQSMGVLMPFGPPIKHLPPVCMQFQLPVDYPTSAQHPPLVSLAASWLGSQQQQALQQQLQQLWEEQGPEPVCFSWLEHIKVSALPALGLTEQLVLSTNVQQQQQQQQQEMAGVGSSRAGAGSQASAQHPAVAAHNGSSSSSNAGCCSSGVVPADQLAMQLLRYDAAREHEDFNNSSWTCTICFEQVG